MSSSDNVIRGGLTSKHVDTDALGEIVHHAPMAPEIIDPQPVEDGVVQFAVQMLELRPEGERAVLIHRSAERPAIIFCTEGTTRFRAVGSGPERSHDIELRAGSAAWIPASLATVEIWATPERGASRLFEVKVP